MCSLEAGAETSRDVADDLGIPTHRASTYLCRLVARGALVRLPGRFYIDRDLNGGSRFKPGDSAPMVRFGRARELGPQTR
jgi:hypothetical protein